MKRIGEKEEMERKKEIVSHTDNKDTALEEDVEEFHRTGC